MPLRRIYFALALIIFACSVQAQTHVRIQTKDGFKYFTSDTSKACNKTVIYASAENNPVYQGGCKSLEADLNERLEINKDTRGDLRVWFVVNCDGEVYGVQFFNNLDSELQDEIKTFLETQQSWTAGKQGGKNVDCEFVLGLKIKKGKIKVINKS